MKCADEADALASAGSQLVQPYSEHMHTRLPAKQEGPSQYHELLVKLECRI